MVTHNLGKIKNTMGIIGLMFVKTTKIPHYIPLPVFEKSIQTAFMRFDIDILFINKLNRVVLKKTMKPWQNFDPGFELGIVGAIEDVAGKFNKIEEGDFVTFEKV